MELLTPDIIIPLGLSAVGLIIWLVRLEGKINSHEKTLDEHNTRLDAHSDRITSVTKDGVNANDLLKAIQNDVRLLVTNIRWILKVAKIDVPTDIFSSEEERNK